MVAGITFKCNILSGHITNIACYNFYQFISKNYKAKTLNYAYFEGFYYQRENLILISFQ